jgi:hypothetical protein
MLIIGMNATNCVLYKYRFAGTVQNPVSEISME